MRQNEDMRKISAWAAIIAVPTMIAGIYGMNFKHMPELGWRFGYPLVLAVISVACRVPLWRTSAASAGSSPESRPGWLDASELRIGLGCMRLSTDEDRDEELALATIAAAVEAGITVFDTARAYGDNETSWSHERSRARCARGAKRRGS